ncbi:hypothetical protein D3C75_333290 [compost metagenome]
MTFEEQIKKLNELVALKATLEEAKNTLTETVKPFVTTIGQSVKINNYVISTAIRNYTIGLLDKHIELVTATLADIQSGERSIEDALTEYQLLMAEID